MLSPLETSDLGNVARAARDMSPVSGLTHGFYRYPARFSPTFVKSVITELTEPGDWVLDPFAGGGTTLVEALANGRNAVGVDISSLAAFVCEAKTLILSDSDADALRHWSRRVANVINIHAPSSKSSEYADAGYYRNLNGQNVWRLRKAIEQALSSVERLRSENARLLARCIVLKTAQWALDGRRQLPSVSKFRDEISRQANSMRSAADEFRRRVEEHGGSVCPSAICLNRTVAGLEDEETIAKLPPPKLVLTSPPYPGIHVLYHRWQVDGRKEAPAPFWIANKLDGAGSSYYTMGDRKYPELKTYFDQLRTNFGSIAKICGPDTVVVQVVAFSKPSWQLQRYLETMNDCGLAELKPWAAEEPDDGRLWRDVPNRKWHARQKENARGAREVVLVHSRNVRAF